MLLGSLIAASGGRFANEFTVGINGTDFATLTFNALRYVNCAFRIERTHREIARDTPESKERNQRLEHEISLTRDLSPARTFFVRVNERLRSVSRETFHNPSASISSGVSFPLADATSRAFFSCGDSV